MTIKTLKILLMSTLIAVACKKSINNSDNITTETQSETETETEVAPTETGSDTDTTPPCNGQCNDAQWSLCTCAKDDPCQWAGDGRCDSYCVENNVVDEMFDDGTDCQGECNGYCDSGIYSDCTCDPSDPCQWAGDGGCDDACIKQGLVQEMFDDGADCEETTQLKPTFFSP